MKISDTSLKRTTTQQESGSINKSAKKNLDTNLATNLATEHQEQACYFEWVDWKVNGDERYKNIFAVPNGGLRDPITAARLKRTGTRPGVPDCIIAYPMFSYEEGQRVIIHGGAGIEFKRMGGRASAAQKDWAQRLRRAGWLVLEDARATDAISFTEDWFRVR